MYKGTGKKVRKKQKGTRQDCMQEDSKEIVK